VNAWIFSKYAIKTIGMRSSLSLTPCFSKAAKRIGIQLNCFNSLNPEFEHAKLGPMSRRVMLTDEAYDALKVHKENAADNFSQIILRFVPPPIRTSRDLVKHLNNLRGPTIADLTLRVRHSRRPQTRRRRR
jgi:predicted CopG family antitoxin